MNESIYIPRTSDSEVIQELKLSFKNLTDLELLVKCLELKIKGLKVEHTENLYFIALYAETNDRGMDTPLRLEKESLYFDDKLKKYSMMEKLIAKGVKIIPKSGALLMPVSRNLAEKINNKYNHRSKV